MTKRLQFMEWFSRWACKWHRWVNGGLDVEEALRDMYRKGKAEGKKQNTVFYGGCPQHLLPLQETDPGLYICPICLDTEPLRAVQKPGDLARLYHRSLLLRGKPPSQMTMKHRTMKLG